MKILLLSFYFSPDLSAGSFRASALLNSILDMLSENDEVHVVTTIPNRYSEFEEYAQEEEKGSKYVIKRIELPKHKSGMVDQSRAFFNYANKTRKFVKGRDYDLVFATSSRLMTATLGAYFARKLRVPLYLDIRDLFVDTIKDILPSKLVWFAKPFFNALEKWTILRASRLNVVSGGFLPYLKSKYPNIKTSVFTNGIDDVFIESARQEFPYNYEAKEVVQKNSKRVMEIVYAGNIGDGQGLHCVIPELAKKLEGEARFRIIGSGGRLTRLKHSLASSGCTNVTVEPPIKREALINIYKNADILFLHLNDYEAFDKVLPSKLFEYAALGKPILAGVNGFPAQFIADNIDNAEVFYPCDVDGALRSIKRLDIKDIPRVDFIRKFNRRAIMDAMALDIKNCYGKSL